MKRIAIIGAGTAGIVQAIALRKKLGDDGVEVMLFEREPSPCLRRGIELSIGSGLQIVMGALGADVRPDLERFADIYERSYVFDQQGTRLEEVEEIMNSTGAFTGASDRTDDGTLVTLQNHCVNRGVFMRILLDKLLASFGRDIVRWNHRLTDVKTEDGKSHLSFDCGAEVADVDLVIGADGVHSALRALVFDSRKARHIGANIIYGVIDGAVDFFHPGRFNILCGNGFSMVAYVYKIMDLKRQTWWAIIFPDPEVQQDGGDHQAFWEQSGNVQATAERLIAAEPRDSVARRYVEATTEFRYSGKFVERDVMDTPVWGIGNAILIGDAAHAVQPWAGAGATLAAEDAYVLADILAKRGFADLEAVARELRESQLDRICYMRQLTLNNTPDGLVPEDLSQPIDWIIDRFGDHRTLESSPAWAEFAKKAVSVAA